MVNGEDTIIIMPCTCQDEFQDKLYGKGMRVHNVSQVKGKLGDKAYCTVCSPRRSAVRLAQRKISDMPPGVGSWEPDVAFAAIARGKSIGPQRKLI